MNRCPEPLLAGHIQPAIWRALRLAGCSLVTPGALDIARVLTWFVRQQPKILHRFTPEQNDGHLAEGVGPDSYWIKKMEMYRHRAEILGLDSPQGRQAMFEFAATALGLCASIWRIHGAPASVTDDFSKGVAGHDLTRKVE